MASNVVFSALAVRRLVRDSQSMALDMSDQRMNYIQFLPSLCWLGFYFIPLLLEYGYLSPGTAGIHLFGATFILGCLFAGDFLNARMWDQPRRRSSGTMSYMLLILGLSFSVFHYVLMDSSIPILEEESNRVQAREEFNKGIPVMLRYIFNWSISIFFPLSFSLFLLRGKYGWAAGAILIGSIYAVSSNAELPIVMFIWISVIILIADTKICRTRWLAMTYTASIVCCITLGLVYKSLLSQAEIQNANNSKQTTIGMTGTAGEIRTLLHTNRTLIHPTVDYLIYRMYFVPVEVSNNWYWYLTDRPRGFQSWRDRFEDESQSLSREIGLNVYQQNYPRHFSDTTNAHSGVDADAFARFGIVGIILVGVMIFGIRLVSLARSQSEVAWSASMITVGILSILPFQASIQAIVGAHGIFILILVQIGLHPAEFLRRIKDGMPFHKI